MDHALHGPDSLAVVVLPLIRTHSDLYRWSAANAHGRQMHEAIDLLEQAAPTEDPLIVFAVTQKALNSAIKVWLMPTTPAASSATPANDYSISIPRQRQPPRHRWPSSSTG